MELSLVFHRTLVSINQLRNLTLENCERSMTSKYRNIGFTSLVNYLYDYDVLNIHKVLQWNCLLIFHRALLIINRFLLLTSEDRERSMTSEYQNIKVTIIFGVIG